MSRPVIGFDLDLTLLDTRPGIAATFRELSRRTGVAIDDQLVVTRLGPPLEIELAHWMPAADVPATAALFRELYPDHAIELSPLLPGAREALAEATAVVITAKHPRLARLHLDHHGLDVAGLVGLAWGDGKAAALTEHGAVAYVGDHTADMRAARTAGVTAVGVTTGPCDADELRLAGADLVLADLTGFRRAELDSLTGRVRP